MKIARYLAHGSEHFGVVDGDQVTAIEGSVFDSPVKLTDHVHNLSDVKLLAPIQPGKILAMGLNYTSHVGDRPAPEYPMIFHKTPTSVIGPEEAIVRPKEVQRFDAEGEMVVVIRDNCKYVSKADALNHVLGYTCGNDVSARDWQQKDRRENNSDWWRAKSADTFSPMGPWIETEADPHAQQTTAHLIFDVPKDRRENNSDWWRAKSADTFSPMGPWIETEPPRRPADAGQRQRGAERDHGAPHL